MLDTRFKKLPLYALVRTDGRFPKDTILKCDGKTVVNYATGEVLGRRGFSFHPLPYFLESFAPLSNWDTTIVGAKARYIYAYGAGEFFIYDRLLFEMGRKRDPKGDWLYGKERKQDPAFLGAFAKVWYPSFEKALQAYAKEQAKAKAKAAKAKAKSKSKSKAKPKK